MTMWLTEDDCQLDDLRTLVEQRTDPDDYPCADAVEQNVLVYGSGLRERASTPEGRRTVQAELARALMDGPGIVVLKQAFEDLSVVDRATEAFNALIAEQRAQGTASGDHFAPPGANDRVWGAQDKLALRDPALFAEDTPPHRPPTSGYGKDVAEAEGYVRGFARRRPDVAVSVLRFAPFAGPGVVSPLLDYLTMPVVPTVLGYDPRLQFVHIDDAVRALALAVAGSHPGTYNVAGDGAMLLSQIMRRLGRVTVPVPSFGTTFFGTLIRQAGILDFTPDQVALVRYGRVLDTERLKTRLGFEPAYSTAEALRAHAEAVRLSPLVPGWTKGY